MNQGITLSPFDLAGERAGLLLSPVLTGSGQFRSPVSCLDGELDTEAPQLHFASRPVGMKLPAVFFAVVHLYAYALRINHHVLLDGRAILVIYELLSPVGVLGGWRKHLDDHVRVAYHVVKFLVTLIAAYRDVGINMARLRELQAYI